MITPAFFRRVATRLLAVLCIAAFAVQAQAPAGLGDRFARVTISAHKPERYPSMITDIDGIQIVNGLPLIVVLRAAYGMPEFRFVDGPDWIYEPNLFHIEAVPPPAELVESDSTRMLRNLLADHFRLQLSETTREMTVLALEFVEETPALQQAEPTMLVLRPGQTEGIAIRGNQAIGGEFRNFYAEFTLPTIASSLTRELKRNVVDMTGLEGIWMMSLESVPRTGPQLQFGPLLEQLGLRVVERTLPLEVLAIRHIERPQLAD